MKLKAKTTLISAGFSLSLVLILTVASLFAFRQFSVSTAKEHARSVAEVVRVALTESMINGVIDKRQQLLTRLAQVEGLREARIIRGPGVIKQFGAGINLEKSIDQIEQRVLLNGEAVYVVSDDSPPIFRATIPFVATANDTPKCLDCHQVESGTVLGAITVSISLELLKRKAIVTIGIMTLTVLLVAVLFTWMFRRQLTPLVEVANGVQRVVAQAKDGDFSGRIEFDGKDEVGQITRDLNRLMEHLQDALGTISRNVAELIGYNQSGGTNMINYTTEMVDCLLDVAHFKQAIEEDMTRKEVYERISRVITEISGIRNCSIYEISTSQNHIRPMVVDGIPDADNRWCNPHVLMRADLCRAQRTGRMVDSLANPMICGMFCGKEFNPDLEHICLPLIHSGRVGNVVQLVVEREHGKLMQLLIPFILVYLRESAPVVEAKRLLDTLRESALRDPLTGLHNRRFLEEYVDTLVASAKRQKSTLSILMLDLDHFKQVNDTFGHEAGDTVLKGLAQAIGSEVRSSDLVIRYGGEEFMVVLQELSNQSCDRLAEKIRKRVEGLKITIATGVLHKTVSIGVARFPIDSEDFWEVVRYADMALYQAKNSGRNRVVCFTPELLESGFGSAG